MEDLRPDEELEAKEFEEATKSRWNRPQFPQMPSRPQMPKRPTMRSFLDKWVIGLILILIILFFARWLNHVLRNDHKKPPATPVVTQPVVKKPAPATPAPAVTPTPTQTSTQVPNTGPGSTAAIFAASVFVAGSTHYVITARKSR